MAMEQIGFVTEVHPDNIKIRVARQSACGGNCHSCSGCPDGAILVTYPNDIENPFSVGEQVTLVMPSETFLKETALTYGSLACGLVLGAVLGYWLFSGEALSLAGAVVGLLISVFFIKYREKRKKAQISLIRHNEKRKQ